MLDQDTRAVIDALDAAQASSGLNKTKFARALSTSASRYSTYRTGKVAPTAAFLIRATRVAESLAASAKRGIPTSLSAAESIQRALADRGETWAFSLILEARDRLDDTMRQRPELLAAWEAGARINDQRWDALFAAIIGHAFAHNGSPRPRWTNPSLLAEEWFPVESIRYSPEQVKRRTPDWLASRNIFVADHDLATA